MPNHCFNQVTIQSSQEDIEKIIEYLRSEKTMFDFNNLVPMPELMKDLHSVHSDGKQYFYSVSKWRNSLNGNDPNPSFPSMDWINKNGVDDFTIRRLTTDYGTADWYDWSCTNWGTKWNAYDVEYFVGPIPNATSIINGRQVTYTLTTAWAEPRPVIRALCAYLSQPGFDQNLEMKWRFDDKMENYAGEISNRDNEPL